MQSRRHSMLETLTNTGVGFVISSALWPLVITPVFHIQASVGENLAITGIFTVTSVARGYLLRRFWNWITMRQLEPQQ